MNEMQRADALTMLDRADQSDPIVQQLRAMVEGMRDLPAGAPWWLLRLRAGAGRLYDRVVAQPLVHRRGRRLVRGPHARSRWAMRSGTRRWGTRRRTSSRGPARGWSGPPSQPALLVIVGIVRWRRSKLAAYLWFERALLVTIFIYEFFAFYQDQLRAVLSLAIVLATFLMLRVVIQAERAREAQAPPAAVADAGGRRESRREHARGGRRPARPVARDRLAGGPAGRRGRSSSPPAPSGGRSPSSSSPWRRSGGSTRCAASS